MKTRAILTACVLLFPGVLVAQGGKKVKAPVPIRLSVSPEGNEARFVVREQLAGAELPNEAIGVTKAITGGITLDGRGGVDSTTSRIVVDLRALTSDRDRRDRFIKARTIVTDSFPSAILVVTGLEGLPAILPVSGEMTLVLTGQLTVHGVTKPSRWDVKAQASGGSIAGRAVTHIHFGEFGMAQPRVAIVLSVVDDIKLEYDFSFVREPVGNP